MFKSCYLINITIQLYNNKIYAFIILIQLKYTEEYICVNIYNIEFYNNKINTLKRNINERLNVYILVT